MSSTSRTTDEGQADDTKLAEWGLDDDEPETEAPAEAPESAPSDEGQPTTAEAAPAAATDSAPAPDGQPTPTPADAPPVTDSAPTTTPVPEPPSETPTAIKADGRELPIPGVLQRANGDLIIPAASRNALQMHLADRREIQRRATEHQRAVADLTATVAQKDQTQAVLVQQFEQLIELGSQDLNALAEWVDRVRGEFPRFMADLQTRQQQAEAERLRQEVETLRLERERPNLEPQWQQALADYAARMVAEDPELEGADPAVVTAMWAELKDRLIVTAHEDAPDGSYKRGGPAANLAELRQILHAEARTARRLREERQKWEAERQVKLAQEAAKKVNAAATAPVKAPPTVTASPKTVSVRNRVALGRARNPDGTFKAGSFDDEWANFDPLAD